MMKKRDGWNRKQRLERVTSLPQMRPIEGRTSSLLRQAREIASFLRYYNFQGVPEGYFDELLDTWEKLEPVPEGGEYPLPEGDMEPSQALLWIFIRQMRALLSGFGNRWRGFPDWYFREVLNVQPLSLRPECVWVCLQKNTTGRTEIARGTPFVAVDEEGDQTFCYRLTRHMEVADVEVTRVLSLWYEHDTPLSPAREWGCVTSLHSEDPRQIVPGMECMFGHAGGRAHLCPLGFTIVSPSLLLREGNRKVTLTLQPENQPLSRFLALLEQQPDDNRVLSPGEKLPRKLVEDIFRLRISTSDGWTAVDRQYISSDPQQPDHLVLSFRLSEEFPSTVPCDPVLHGFAADHPALQVELQPDAWLYPYSWLREFMLRSIHLAVEVEGISHLLVYNELGQLDTSKPFQPFGLSAERGSWFAVGNYEMAIKPLQSVSLNLHWGALPDDPEGWEGYYREYDCGIDNTSFRIQPRFLNERKWSAARTDHPCYLFATATGDQAAPLPGAPLVPESQWKHIPLQPMAPVSLSEEEYGYSISSVSGFLSFVLEEPAMGFGQERYRYLFTNRMIRDILRRKELRPLNTPYVPSLERLTLSYRSEDTIDLHSPAADRHNRFFHLFPLGQQQVFPAASHTPVPLIHSLPGHAHLLLGLRGVVPGERVSLYLCFRPLGKEIPGDVLPRVIWYYGDGYHWKPFPDLCLMRDTTRGLLTNGCVEFSLPDEEPVSDSHGTLWLRAAVQEYEAYIPPLEAVYTPVAELLWEPGEAQDPGRRRQIRQLIPGKKVPGITGACVVSPFSDGRDSESESERLCRISEYITHRGRALLPRDYEWLVLQLFPQVRKVKCLPGYDPAGKEGAVVSLVVVADAREEDTADGLPRASSDLLYTIRRRLREYVSPAIARIEVFNPVYEELMVRCQVSFHRHYALGECRRWLRELCDLFIAPWYFRHAPPAFDRKLSARELGEEMARQEYVRSVAHLSLVRMSEYKGNHLLQEYTGTEEELRPLLPHGVFVPFREHLFLSEADTPFGLGEMSVDSNWIVTDPLQT